MEVKIKINPFFDKKSIKELLTYYCVGKAKIKDLSYKVNNEECNINYILKQNDELVILYYDEIDFIPDDQPLKIIYEDKYLLIVDKKANLLVHPDDKTKTGTLANHVAAYYQKTGQNISVRYLHRIDYDTTGLVIFSKDILCAAYLNKKIETHELAREYLCLASGNFKEDKGMYNEKIAEDRHQANKKRIGPTGKEAITYYQVLERLSKNLNLIKVKLATGRTHQIRVHFAYHGHPLVGDALYNGNTNLLNRQALHSAKVEFIHPITMKMLKVQAKMPLDMQKIYEKHRKKTYVESNSNRADKKIYNKAVGKKKNL